MTFNDKVDKFMKDNNISDIKKLAINSGIPYTTLRDFYNKKSADNSRLSTIRKLAKYMNCTIDYLAYDDISRQNEIKLDGFDMRDDNDYHYNGEMTTAFEIEANSEEAYSNIIKKMDELGINYKVLNKVSEKKYADDLTLEENKEILKAVADGLTDPLSKALYSKASELKNDRDKRMVLNVIQGFMDDVDNNEN